MSSLSRMLALSRAPRATQYVDNFSASEGSSLSSSWDFTGTWAIGANNTAVSAPTLGAELFVNGSFAADTNWTKGTGWAIASGTGNHSGATQGIISQAVGAIGNWYHLVWDIASISGSTAAAAFGAATNAGNTYNAPQSGIITNKYQLTGTSLGFLGAANTVCSIDNVSAKQITTSHLFATRTFPNLSCRQTVRVTMVNDTRCGLVGWMDDYSNPLNYITATHSGVAVHLIKVVAGVPTVLVSSTTTYVANAVLELRGARSGSSLSVGVFYNGVQRGTTQTVSDAGIISNTRHGMMNSYSGNSLKDYRIS